MYGGALFVQKIEIGRWGGRDKVIPPKKRRGSFVGDEEKSKAKLKSKTTKKHVQVQQNGDHDDERVDKETGGIVVKKKIGTSKRGGGGVLVQGSRCSRVNGRGWRCCQQTLIGYSLCEHHLGKGRLRSMTSVRSRATAAAPKKSTAPMKEELSSLLSLMVEEKEEKILLSDDNDDYYNDHDGGDDDDDHDDDDHDGGDDEKPKKRMKIGMVKARSMSSLLGQTSNVMVVVSEKSGAYEDK